MRTVKIQRVKIENIRVKTFFFEDEFCSSAEPGQFVMVWIPGVDEIPLSLSSISEDKFSSITVAEVGEATRALSKLSVGAVIGVRGPFGNHFKIIGKEALVIGGGTGMASLIGLIRKLLAKDVKTMVIQGAETISELLFLKQLTSLSAKSGLETVFTTEDGSYGIKGVVTESVERVLFSRKFDMAYTCGPEKMISKVYFLARKYGVSLQACLERLMRCAVGICGSCVIGKYRVCKDGPVFDQTQLATLEEKLGKFKYGFSGEKVPV
jgi:dihydroorotate dehydrogenase electron transfer subunit